MKWVAMMLLLIACAGCSVTLSGNAKWSETDGAVQELEALKQKHLQLSTVINSMTQELQTAPADLEAVNTVLKKYGIERK